ncbi:5-amino-6-(5-phosphoribosylamino)uracil reductase [candidate division MSBL1 archaeon SCGC-AAA261G05]|uniref:2,5-diamino-6-(ribosylamino)-4(3H)-pyrimidinone 5'-phosphate reductase n=3 Tax=candidate division MSBL1 TaxID=215777 RepID=A0A133V123_9EURY|nr:5-amino-6-(5-phosphoribosylamino)uracil reductase [candidate division MSBL1 archaeon SCGC-AAA261C02]KXB04234.1 5-amino-6-(5-phosphoribosylamino)uracil reductase [candidate division MSBL1 archaeon SCGC-AAA261G05]KXB05097.1 5-amino-6-(5-phosphoribosylamino)uracil reductase [candidate division MSBL1 archaeon SCGC-AAA261O19]
MDRPNVILNAGMTLDGKISTIGGDSKISCEEDLKRVHELRAKVDAVMVGIGTVISDNPILTVRRAKGRNPIRIVVDSLGKTPSDAKILDGSAQSIVAVTTRASEKEKNRLQDKGAEVLVLGDEKVDLTQLLEHLRKRGVEKLLLEGGSTLNWSMLHQRLVDEIQIAVAPKIVGGKKAKTLVDGVGVRKIADGVHLEFQSSKIVGENLLLTYRVKGLTNDSENK